MERASSISSSWSCRTDATRLSSSCRSGTDGGTHCMESVAKTLTLGLHPCPRSPLRQREPRLDQWNIRPRAGSSLSGISPTSEEDHARSIGRPREATWGTRIRRARTASVRPALLNDRRRGLQQQLDVPAQAPARDVHVVELDHLVEGDVATPHSFMCWRSSLVSPLCRPSRVSARRTQKHGVSDRTRTCRRAR